MIFRFLFAIALAGGPAGWLMAQSNNSASSPAGPQKVILYFNDLGELTTPEKCVIRRETSMDLIDLMVTGIYRDYNKNGKLIADGFLNQGVMKGLQTEYFEDGRVRSTIEHEENGFIIWELTNDRREGEVTHGTGKFSLVYRDFDTGNQGVQLKNRTLIGEFQRGKRTGTWIYLERGGDKTDEEFYEQGVLVNRITFDQSGATYLGRQARKSITIGGNAYATEALSVDKAAYSRLNEYFEKNMPGYPGISKRPITYPGGIKNMLLFIAQNLTIPQTGEVYPARLRVDEHGAVTFRFSPFLNPYLEKEFTRLIKVCQPKLLPAVKDGKAISSSLRIPISNASWWIDFLTTASSEEIYSYIRGLWYNR